MRRLCFAHFFHCYFQIVTIKAVIILDKTRILFRANLKIRHRVSAIVTCSVLEDFGIRFDSGKGGWKSFIAKSFPMVFVIVIACATDSVFIWHVGSVEVRLRDKRIVA
ncbi:hypothetical protein F4778DRAFT_745569 [Xylariomycetidae sp. FL2044]|nr:hypothetical protein F4778DRAFT_745569 [Xylariomycetidae sp. FL2044]